MNSNISKLKEHFEAQLQNSIKSKYTEDTSLHLACKYGLEGSGKESDPF